MEAANRTTHGGPAELVNLTFARGAVGAVISYVQPEWGATSPMLNSVCETRLTSTMPASPAS